MILRNVEILGASGVHDVAIESQTIRQIVPRASGDAAGIDLNGALAFPGLINSHDHLDFNCYRQFGGGPYRDYVEWSDAIRRRHAAELAAVGGVPRALRIRAGIAKNALCGVTCVAQHGPDAPCSGDLIHIIQGTKTIHSPRLGGRRAMLFPGDRPLVAHVGEGVGSDAEREIDSFIRWNVWRRRMIGVHAIAMRADQAKRFAALVWCPVSNEHLFGRTASVDMLKEHAAILFGTDSTLTASWNIWEHLRRARALHLLRDDELIAAVSANAAEVWKLTGRGRIAPGAVADIVVARKRSADQRDAFFAINPEDILLVIANGVVVLLDASLRASIPAARNLFPTTVNGVEKLTLEDYSELAQKLRDFPVAVPYLQP
jgi:cytosine/adenosine deaminase-related metal-dependent hydrolase